MANVINTNSLKAGILDSLADTYRQQMPVAKAIQDKVLYRLPDVKQRYADYVFKDVVPFPEPWPYGAQRTHKGFKDRLINLGIYPFDLTISWNRFDEQDDILADTRRQAELGAKRFLQLPDVMISEYLNGVASYNPVLNNAFDGADLFNATDGDGNARFGVTGGNILTSSGLTVDAIIHDMAEAVERFIAVQDPAGQPLLAPEDCDMKNLFCIIPKELNEVFLRASKSEYIKLDAANATSESNYVKGTFEYKVFNRLTSPTTWYVILNHSYWKPFVWREKGLSSIASDIGNSDISREQNIDSIYTDQRLGLGIWAPWTILEVSAS